MDIILSDDEAALPLMPLRDAVVYPQMALPLFVGREKSVQALHAAIRADKRILVVAQKTNGEKNPDTEDLYEVGVVARLVQLMQLPDGTHKALVEGEHRVRVCDIVATETYLTARYQLLAEQPMPDEREQSVMIRSVNNHFAQYAKLNQRIPPDLVTTLAELQELSHLVDSVAAQANLKLIDKQALLETLDVGQRAEHLLALIQDENELLDLEKNLHKRVRDQIEKNQREYLLHEKMKALQKEMRSAGNESGELAEASEAEQLEKKINSLRMSKEGKDKAKAELNKLKMLSPMSSEAGVVRSYLDVLLKVPWNKRSRVGTDIQQAQKILDEDHYGLEKVKERILEYLAVQQRVRKLKGPILCLVGPPGVGKTSLGESIARATRRKYVRMALGGVRDEAEIRGHRRTYVSALPGKIIQGLSRAGVKNPLFLLDEIDKMAMDARGDPASALLEVLDPEQNHTFQDHYLELDFDLSDVMFVATANSLNIPAPLLDRMEVIRLSGYTEDEKINIAENYLLPKQIKNNGLKSGELQATPESIRDVVRYYTREAGVRGLEREVAKICRKVVKGLVTRTETAKHVNLEAPDLEKYLGVQRFRYGRAEEKDQIGQVAGLAWTEVGGELLRIEAELAPGKGRLVHTGKLGDVMKESIQAALTVVRVRAASLGLKDDFHRTLDVHIHVPEGATPKDGPSAGISMSTVLVSALTRIPVCAEVAMTGEITLRGEVLPIGGLKEKLLAAHRGGIRTVIIPAENERDLAEIPDNIKEHLTIHPVRWIDQVWDIALSRVPTPRLHSEDNCSQALVLDDIVTGDIATTPELLPRQ
ncbi:MAG: endopeptidase La [Pseudomonadota bacterium]